ncbi:hypothetical protein [Sandaracinobacteroides hominis]|uniref:hypothetical protein n=1 Tax=Sandaracinobacteroides hominis TaxID=2780086 RepID=UPI0018F52128|nr:hypothetical protein [Sandaracinobacteroides hominis]
MKILDCQAVRRVGGTWTIKRSAEYFDGALAIVWAEIGDWPLQSEADIRRALRERRELVGSCPRHRRNINVRFPIGLGPEAAYPDSCLIDFRMGIPFPGANGCLRGHRAACEGVVSEPS